MYFLSAPALGVPRKSDGSVAQIWHTCCLKTAPGATQWHPQVFDSAGARLCRVVLVLDS